MMKEMRNLIEERAKYERHNEINIRYFGKFGDGSLFSQKIKREPSPNFPNLHGRDEIMSKNYTIKDIIDIV